MIGLLVVLAYFGAGLLWWLPQVWIPRFVDNHRRYWPNLTRTSEDIQKIRREAFWMGLPVALVWPAHFVLWALQHVVLGVSKASQTEREITLGERERELRNRELRIRQLEREAGIQ